MEESKLWRCLREIASDYIRWGCGMAYRMLRGEGWTLNQSAGVTALAEGRLAASYSQEAKVVTARSRSVRRERIQHPPRWGPWTPNAPITAASVSRSGLSSRMITTTHAHKASADKGGDFPGFPPADINHDGFAVKTH